jgi:hypothetical protein
VAGRPGVVDALRVVGQRDGKHELLPLVGQSAAATTIFLAHARAAFGTQHDTHILFFGRLAFDFRPVGKHDLRAGFRLEK